MNVSDLVAVLRQYPSEMLVYWPLRNAGQLRDEADPVTCVTPVRLRPVFDGDMRYRRHWCSEQQYSTMYKAFKEPVPEWETILIIHD